jgi:hypothetical protein
MPLRRSGQAAMQNLTDGKQQLACTTPRPGSMAFLRKLKVTAKSSHRRRGRGTQRGQRHPPEGAAQNRGRAGERVKIDQGQGWRKHSPCYAEPGLIKRGCYPRSCCEQGRDHKPTGLQPVWATRPRPSAKTGTKAPVLCRRNWRSSGSSALL